MGCCHSSTSSTSPPTTNSPARNPSTHARPNTPIRPPSPLLKTPKNVSRHSPPWTRSIYEREIEVFFETRISGSREVWETLRVVCEELRRGNIGAAQTILDAAGLSVPNGRVSRTRSQSLRDAGGQRVRGGVFDEGGRVYEVPSWVLSVPRDLIEDPPPEKDVNASDDEDEQAPASPRMEKGKGRAQDVGVEQRVKVRYNDLPRDSTFVIGSKQSIAVLREKVMEDRGVERVRLVLMGKLLEDGKRLEDVGWREGMMINAFVSSPQEGQQ